jgi:hypothetical protein
MCYILHVLLWCFAAIIYKNGEEVPSCANSSCVNVQYVHYQSISTLLPFCNSRLSTDWKIKIIMSLAIINYIINTIVRCSRFSICFLFEVSVFFLTKCYEYSISFDSILFNIQFDLNILPGGCNCNDLHFTICTPFT